MPFPSLLVLVSIPAGFSDALRRRSSSYGSRLIMFQSLLGFLMRCDGAAFQMIGFDEVFQSLLGFLMRCDFSDAKVGPLSDMFQSLLGFLMRCDDLLHR